MSWIYKCSSLLNRGHINCSLINWLKKLLFEPQALCWALRIQNKDDPFFYIAQRPGQRQINRLQLHVMNALMGAVHGGTGALGYDT